MHGFSRRCRAARVSVRSRPSGFVEDVRMSLDVEQLRNSGENRHGNGSSKMGIELCNAFYWAVMVGVVMGGGGGVQIYFNELCRFH